MVAAGIKEAKRRIHVEVDRKLVGVREEDAGRELAAATGDGNSPEEEEARHTDEEESKRALLAEPQLNCFVPL